MKNANKAWAEDQLGRKAQSEAIVSYLKGRSNKRRNSGLSKGFVLAIESEYGQGKSYFVRNTMLDVSENHPACLIDAWTDDRINSPFLAILDGIENALEPFFDTDSKIRETTSKLFANTGSLAWSAAKGAGKQLAKKVVGDELEDLVSEVADSDDEDEGDDSDSISEISDEGIEAGVKRVDKLSDSSTAKGLKEYRQQKLSMARLRKRLVLLGQQIEANKARSLPIFVFIDELDRCRPDYAISLLEEVKHLFDVPGFVFVLSIQKKQLLNSICAVYGSNFDAGSYLDRFVDKFYALDNPSCKEFVELELKKEPLGDEAFLADCVGWSVSERIAMVFNHYGLSLRETERALDILRASIELIGGVKVDPIYLASCVVQHMGIKEGDNRATRARFRSVVIDWVDNSNQIHSVQKTDEIKKFKDILFRVSQCASWSEKTVKQQQIHVNRPDMYYSQLLAENFFEQFEYSQPEDVTMAAACQKVLTQVKPFDFNV